MKKLLVLLVSVLMALSLCACTPKKDPEPEPVDLDSLTYDEASAYVYDACFKEQCSTCKSVKIRSCN